MKNDYQMTNSKSRLKKTKLVNKAACILCILNLSGCSLGEVVSTPLYITDFGLAVATLGIVKPELGYKTRRAIDDKIETAKTEHACSERPKTEYHWETPVPIPNQVEDESTVLTSDTTKIIQSDPFFKGPSIIKKVKLKYKLIHKDNDTLNESFVNTLYHSDGPYILKRTSVSNDHHSDDSSRSTSEKIDHDESELVANGLFSIRHYTSSQTKDCFPSKDLNYKSFTKYNIKKVAGTLFPPRRGRQFAFYHTNNDSYGLSHVFYLCTWGETKKASTIFLKLQGDVITLSCYRKSLFESNSFENYDYNSTITDYFSKQLNMFVDDFPKISKTPAIQYQDVSIEVTRQ